MFSGEQYNNFENFCEEEQKSVSGGSGEVLNEKERIKSLLKIFQ